VGIIAILVWKIADLKNTNAQLLAYNQKLSAQIESVDRSSALQQRFVGKRVPMLSLVYLNAGSRFTFPDRKNAVQDYLFILFTPEDCYSCFAEVPFWKELEQKFKDCLKVFAVGAAISREQLQYFVKRNNVQIPVLYDSESGLFKELGLAGSGITPIKILSTSQGRIIHVSRSTGENRQLRGAVDCP